MEGNWGEPRGQGLFMRYILSTCLIFCGLSGISLAGQPSILLLSTGGDAGADKIKSEISQTGNSVLEVPAEEADVSQAGILSNGGAVIVPDAEGGYKVYDGGTGGDITKKFNAGLSSKDAPPPAAEPKPEPEPRKIEKAAPQPRPKEASAFKKNHIGLTAGVFNFKKNEDSLDLLATNPVTEASHTKAVGRLRVFFEHYFSRKYGIGLAVGMDKGGKATYDNSGRTLNVSGSPKSATLYVMRRFGRHFGLYLGGGADMVSISVEDPSNLAGLPSGPATFKGNAAIPHGEAGLVLSAGNFSLRFILKQLLGDGADNITTSAGGSEYRLTTLNGNSVSYKASGQALSSNEKYFKVDMGGFASGVTLNYAFASW